MAVAEIEATLSKLATEIPRDFAAYDDAKQLWKTASAEYQERTTAMVEKLRTVLETRADELEECTALRRRCLSPTFTMRPRGFAISTVTYQEC